MIPIDTTTQSVRLALSQSLAQAEIASRNIARASQPGAQAQVADFAASIALLERAADGSPSTEGALADALAEAADAAMAPATRTVAGPIAIDAQVAEAAGANLRYQTLGESLSRHFALMRLAITGRS